MPAHILIVDPDRPIVDCLAFELHRHGHTVRIATDGVQALAHLAQAPADLILTDEVMPIVNGKTLLQELRDRGDATHVVLVTSVPYTGSDLAAVSFLHKPFEIRHVLIAVRNALALDPATRPVADWERSWPLFGDA